MLHMIGVSLFQAASFAGASSGITLAHRGGLNQYPEDSLQAFTSSVADGNLTLEMDAWLLSDGAIALMHDSTVDRTTTGTGGVTSFDTAGWAALTLDGSSWLGGSAQDVAPPLLSAVVAATQASGAIYYIECKHSAVAGPLLTYINASGLPKSRFVVCSFTLSDLAALEADGVRTQYLTSTGTQLASALLTATRTVCINASVDKALIATWAAAGFRVQLYTIDRRYIADQFPRSYDIISNDPSYLRQRTAYATQDNFAGGNWMHGTQSATDSLTEIARGRFFPGNFWGWSSTSSGGSRAVLQGWACPVKNTDLPSDFTIDFVAKIDGVDAGDATRWGGVFLASRATYDRPFRDGAGADPDINGWHILFRKSGLIQIYKINGNVADSKVTYTGAALADGEEFRVKIIVSPTTITASRCDVSTGAVIGSATWSDPDYRGAYFHFSRNGAAVKFRSVNVT